MVSGPPTLEDLLIVEAQLIGLSPSAEKECQMPNPRANRVAKCTHGIVASLVTNRLKDLRPELVIVTDVCVAGDLQHTTVFYTAYDDQRRLRDAGRTLDRAKGNIRSHVRR